MKGKGDPRKDVVEGVAVKSCTFSEAWIGLQTTDR